MTRGAVAFDCLAPSMCSWRTRRSIIHSAPRINFSRVDEKSRTVKRRRREMKRKNQGKRVARAIVRCRFLKIFPKFFFFQFLFNLPLFSFPRASLTLDRLERTAGVAFLMRRALTCFYFDFFEKFVRTGPLFSGTAVNQSAARANRPRATS